MDKDQILYNAIIYSQGYVKVTNYGGKFAIVEDGVYRIEDRFGSEYPKKNKSQVLSIFKKLVHRYHNIEVDGVEWTYDRGKWRNKEINR